jgi:glycosyltransferase involved in cell wall biosynthesis
MNQPEFSIIIPCYKAENSITQALGAVMDQDFKNFEVICVLDGPDENTERIIKTFPQVKYEVLPKNMGAPAARNRGFALSSGKYVIFSDSDVYWHPGMFRKFKETFEKNPDVDFVYGGYKWTDMEGAHVPHDFDPYLLNVMNYIDTGNPVKREWVEKVGGWDETLKRWQDWDLWLRIVKAGAKGMRIEEITRSADFPKAGKNISGQDNYAPTYHIVRKKHGFENKPVCFTTIAAYGHGLRIAKACGWDFWHNPAMIPLDYEAIYLLGMFPEGVQDHVSLFMDGRTRVARNCKYFIHWIGTDILHMRTGVPFVEIKNMRLMFEKHNVTHFFQSEQNRLEMEELGFKGEVLPLPVLNEFERVPLPEKFTVAVYDHGGIDQKWHKWLAMELSKAMPDIDWIFFGNKNAVGKEGNTEWLGKVPIKDVIKRASVLFRFTIHDGYPVAPVEFMLSGRRVITNVPDMKYTTHVNLGAVNDDRVAELKGKVYGELRRLQAMPAMTDAEFKEIKNHYETLLSPEGFKKRVLEILENEKAKNPKD